jgi:oligoendopeptidase F
VHGQHTLLFLYQLLRSPDRSIRQEAADVFSAFVLGMRVTPAGASSGDAIDEVFNPGRQNGRPRSAYDNSLTRKHAVLQTFRDNADEKQRIDFWRSWYEASVANVAKAL